MRVLNIHANWFRRFMSVPDPSYNPLADTIWWRSAQERDAMQASISELIGDAWRPVVSYIDGRKLKKSMNVHTARQSSEFNFKGHGRNVLLWCDHFGNIRHVEVNFPGSENDRGMYNKSHFFNNHTDYLRPHETLCGDNIFKGPKGRTSRLLNGESPDTVTPYNRAQLANDPTGVRKIFNVYLHRKRAVIENVFMRIAEWRIVTVPWRGELESQGDWCLACSYLTQYIMDIRNKKPCVKAKNEKKVNGWHFFSFVVFFNLRHEINRQRHYLYGLKFLRLVAEKIILFFRGIYRSFFSGDPPPKKTMC